MVIPIAVERSTFVLASSAALGLMFWNWRPLASVVWDVQTSSARAAL
jgi:methanethiol S-methyltransferase